MKTNNLKVLLLTAALVIGSTPLWAQTSVPATPTVVASTPALSTAPVPTTVSPATVPPVAPAPVVAMAPTPAPTTLTTATPPLPDSNALMSTGQGTDPAITAVLDRLKQDTTPLSISDMSSAQDALARLNLMNEIEQKLSQIEETRAKRLGVAGMAGLDSGSVGSLAPQQVLNQASGFGGGAPSRHHSSSNAQILAISGASGRYSATIDWNGREMIVKPGSFLPDGSKVIKVGADEVVTAFHGKNTTLSFAEAKTADNGGGHTISSPTAPPNNPASN